MINLPQIEVNITGKHISVKAIQDGSLWPDNPLMSELKDQVEKLKQPSSALLS